MDRTLKALSLILSYPTRELQLAMPEIGGVLASDTRLTAGARRALRPLVEELAGRDIYDLQETFVMLFDRSRTLSLNLFEHVHGESRDRGGAMVSLVETYREGGFDPVTSELPDHLPVLLEFLATRPFAEAQNTLAASKRIRRLWPKCWRSLTTTPPIWRLWMRFGKKAKCSSALIQTPDARKCAICFRAWIPQ